MRGLAGALRFEKCGKQIGLLPPVCIGSRDIVVGPEYVGDLLFHNALLDHGPAGQPRRKLVERAVSGC